RSVPRHGVEQAFMPAFKSKGLAALAAEVTVGGRLQVKTLRSLGASPGFFAPSGPAAWLCEQSDELLKNLSFLAERESRCRGPRRAAFACWGEQRGMSAQSKNLCTCF